MSAAPSTQARLEANQAYFFSGEWRSRTYRGQTIFKYPSDLWMYHEVIHRVRPDVIIETGTCSGGSALYFRDQMRSAGTAAVVITMDVDASVYRLGPEDGIHYLNESSIAPSTVSKVAALAAGRPTLVSLDADHTKDHVVQELALYWPLVSKGSYIVVEDTFLGVFDCLGGVEQLRFRATGTPDMAVEEFLRAAAGTFVRDEGCESFLTMNPGGWLKRVVA